VIGNEFTCEDKNGIIVAYSRECWYKHIIIHPEMIDSQGVVKAVIETPNSEYQDVRHLGTRNYYKQLILPYIGITLVKVSVQYRKVFGKERGFIKTAYATDKVKKGEVWLWGQKFVN
jgi:ribosomal 30S subunit maturation factor RimM